MQFYVDFGTAINHGFYLDLDELCGFEVLRDNLNLPDLGLTEEFSKSLRTIIVLLFVLGILKKE